VTALKDSANGDFKVIQSDTKISGGSSGSPAFDEEGSGWGTHIPEPPRSMTYAPSEVPAGAPPTRGPTIYIKEEDLEGGTRRCAQCNRRKKRTKRNKKI
jgi:hypothetical protein